MEQSTRVSTTPPHVDRSRQLHALTRANLDDLLGGFGLEQVTHGRRALNWLAHLPARRFAQQVITYDDHVGAGGLSAGGTWALQHFVQNLLISHPEHVPRAGPTLIVANHPGLCDTAALFAAIERADLRVIAAARPFLQALPNTSRYLLFVDADPATRLHVLRSAARHLRAGGAVLTFPAGAIEPDPALLPGAAESIEQWSGSIDVLARLAPNLTIVPAIVSGVLSPRALRHPLTYLRKQPKDRQWLAALLQIQLRSLRRVTVQVAFGPPIQTNHAQITASLNEVVKTEAQRLIAALAEDLERQV